MNSFLERWLVAVVPVLHREISNRVEFAPAQTLPSPTSAVSLAISIGNGHFIVSAELSDFAALLEQAGLAIPQSDAHHNSELWRAVIREAGLAAAKDFGAKVESIDDASWSLGLASAAYQIRLGDATMLVAFTDQVISSAASDAEPRSVQAPGIEATMADRPGIDLLLDVELEASLRFGCCELSLNEVLELGPGDVLELDRHVADPVDLLVGDKIVARGEVVLVNGAFGLRVLEVAEPRKCLESVRCLF